MKNGIKRNCKTLGEKNEKWGPGNPVYGKIWEKIEFCLGSKGEIMKNGIPKIAKFLGKMKIEVKETQFLEIFGRKIFKWVFVQNTKKMELQNFSQNCYKKFSQNFYKKFSQSF